MVAWNHDGSLINTDRDSRYSVNIQEMNLYILNIPRVEVAVLGMYQAVVTAGNSDHSDTVLLAFPGKTEWEGNGTLTFACMLFSIIAMTTLNTRL